MNKGHESLSSIIIQGLEYRLPLKTKTIYKTFGVDELNGVQSPRNVNKLFPFHYFPLQTVPRSIP